MSYQLQRNQLLTDAELTQVVGGGGAANTLNELTETWQGSSSDAYRAVQWSWGSTSHEIGGIGG